MSGATCTCGCAEPHVVMSRMTADGLIVELWSDGPVTGAVGLGLPGIPMRRPRTPEALRVALKAGRLLLGEVCIHDRADLADLYAAAEWAAKRDGLPGTMRARMRAVRERPLLPKLAWVVQSADRDGRPTSRFAMLPRLLYPGRAVVDHCGYGQAGGVKRYELVDVVRDRCGDLVGSATGFSFANLAELWAFLRGEAATAPEDGGATPSMHGGRADDDVARVGQGGEP